MTTTISAATVTKTGSGEVTLAANSTIAQLIAAVQTALFASIPTVAGYTITAPTAPYDSGVDSSNNNFVVYKLAHKTLAGVEYLVIKFIPGYTTGQYTVSQQLTHTWSTTNHAPTASQAGQTYTQQTVIDLTKTTTINYVKHLEASLVYLEQSGQRVVLGYFYPATPNTWNQSQSLPVFIANDPNFLNLNATDSAYTPHPNSSSAYSFLFKWPDLLYPNETSQTSDVVSSLPIGVYDGHGIAANFSTDLIAVAAAGSAIRTNSFTPTGTLTGTYTMILSNPGQPSLAIATA